MEEYIYIMWKEWWVKSYILLDKRIMRERERLKHSNVTAYQHIHGSLFKFIINPQHACARVIVVSLSVCLSTSDFEVSGVFHV